MDGFILATLAGWGLGRAAYIMLNFQEFGFNILSYLDFSGKPGISLAFFAVGSFLTLYRFAKRHDWDEFEILDFWSMALAVGMIVLTLGWLISGVHFGNPTTLPWGMNFPQVFDYRHPTQIYTLIAFSLLLAFLVRVEYKYRTFKWYKGGRSTAQTGFLFAFFMIATGAFWTIISSFRLPQLVVMGFEIDWLAGLFVSISGLIFLLVRQGKLLTNWRRKKYDSRSVFKGTSN